MKIVSSEFVKSVSIQDEKIFFEKRNEVVFVGRSNVGKSSLMNALMQKKDLVKTSSKPGKTRTANIFFVNEKYHFTDLPGYGFAKMGQTMREDLDSLISWYLEEKKHTIKQVVLVCDGKIGPQQTDIDMYKYITEDIKLPITVVMSKIDKLGKGEVSKTKAFTQSVFFGARVMTISSVKKDGIDDLRKVIGEALSHREQKK
ncbi:YihA family ribosome biogenesis GTP-binding protein [Candidatus Gracilibacteria bacterium]|nr:YihA family ribosome biogenesis GTP-binding protein [Candidatus Gracilibacteria bacterium]